ncbi:GNAT family N-acetyltransferase [Alkalicoccus luteus]|uniref:GNAT family N-acetyltransferase n=1 Tax=Alkalicoccus luteus TaxID=1237094 RepID=A0A969TVB5_9BACI|nr:GNAT family protein [Alkalicoccus luteus]NJP36189.1 GNAT family N-acetyltransferase [Alkalicoccus luteus]
MSRLKLSPVSEEDAPVYHRWRTDWEVMQHTSMTTAVPTYSETVQFVQEVLIGQKAAESWMLELSTGRTIGIASLIQIDVENQSAECILDIGEKNCWGQGFGQEAMRLLLYRAFEDLTLHRVQLRVFADNVRAVGLYNKMGFLEEGRMQEALLRNGRRHDILLMRLLRPEWEKIDFLRSEAPESVDSSLED